MILVVFFSHFVFCLSWFTGGSFSHFLSCLSCFTGSFFPICSFVFLGSFFPLFSLYCRLGGCPVRLRRGKETGQAANAIENTESIIDISRVCYKACMAPARILRWQSPQPCPSSWPSANAVTLHPHASGVSQQQPGSVRCCSAPLLVRKLFRFRCVSRGRCSGRQRVGCGAYSVPHVKATLLWRGTRHSVCTLTLILASP